MGTILCWQVSMDVTRRQVIGLGALALGAVRLPPTATAADAGPALFELGLGDLRPTAAWHTTAALTAPRRFDLLGLRWARGTGVQAQARARARGGRWTRWTALPHSHGAGVPGTDPAFTGAADEFQLRLRGEARGLAARFVRALGHAPSRPRAHAAQVSTPAIVPRASWGADQVPPRSPASYGSVAAAFVHHTAGAIEYAPEDSPAIVLGIARYHRDSNGWNDIGYNFLVDRYGVVF